MGANLQAFERAKPIGEEAQLALGGELGVEQLQGAGRGIARVGVLLVAALGLDFVDARQFGAGHVDFAAGFEEFGRLVGVQPQGHLGNRADVVRDVVAFFAVAARDAGREQAIVVGQRHGDAVDLQLDDVNHLLAAERLADARVEFAQLVVGLALLDRQHGNAVNDLAEAGDRLPADALSGAVGRNQLGVLFFQFAQLVVELVEVAVGDFRLGLNVVQAVVALDLSAQLGNALAG